MVPASRPGFDAMPLRWGAAEAWRVARCLSAGLALAVAAATAAHADDSLRLGVPRLPPVVAYYVAEEQGFFAAEGVAVKLVDCQRSYACLADVVEGRAELAAVPNLPLVFKRFERQDFALLASVVTTLDSIDLVANRRAGIAAPGQLAGKRVGVAAGTASAYYLDLLLAQAGVDPASVTSVPLLPERMAAALAEGRVDAISTWEPFTQQAVQALGDQAKVLPDAGTYLDSNNLVAAQRLVGPRDAALAAVLRALDRANAYITAQPAAAQAVMRRRMQVDQGFVERVWPHLRFRLSLDQALLSTLEAEARWARREGHVTGETIPNFLAMIHAGPLKTVKPGAVGAGR